MRDGGLDVQALVVQRLELLVILLRGVHLDLQRVDLQQLGALLEVVLPVVRLAAGVQLLQHPGQLAVVLPVEVQLAQLGHGLEPQPLVLGVPEGVQRRLVEVLR